jgi:hypothetical protein
MNFVDCDKRTAFANHCRLKKNKKPCKLNAYKVFFVESGRVELPSKQATKKLSTRLVPD